MLCNLLWLQCKHSVNSCQHTANSSYAFGSFPKFFYSEYFWSEGGWMWNLSVRGHLRIHMVRFERVWFSVPAPPIPFIVYCSFLLYKMGQIIIVVKTCVNAQRPLLLRIKTLSRDRKVLILPPVLRLGMGATEDLRRRQAGWWGSEKRQYRISVWTSEGCLIQRQDD